MSIPVLSWSQFVGVGLAFALVGEIVNNLIVGIPEVSPIGNLLFAIVFYTGTLTFAYSYQTKRVNANSRMSLLGYIAFFALAVGLVFNEWLLVGNHPFNPAVVHPLSQLGMVAFHGTMYGIPMLITQGVLVPKIAKRLFLYLVLIAFVPTQIIFTDVSSEIEAALALAGTYFMGYIVVFGWLLYRVSRSRLVSVA